MRQCNAFTQHGRDNFLALYHRRVKCLIDIPFFFQLRTHMAKQLRLRHRFIDDHEVFFVDQAFYPSVVEREEIVSTMLGEGIALPHSLGLLAKKTVVITLLSQQGIAWGEGETAHVIFLLAISKADYEEAMAIYDLFVTFVRERSMSRLLSSENFESFKAIAIDCLSRI